MQCTSLFSAALELSYSGSKCEYYFASLGIDGSSSFKKVLGFGAAPATSAPEKSKPACY